MLGAPRVTQPIKKIKLVELRTDRKAGGFIKVIDMLGEEKVLRLTT